jgi:hypothetical protein
MRDDTVSNSGFLNQPITEDELLQALKKGGKNKAPGGDGMCLEFYTENWPVIKQDLLELMNHMFMERGISTTQKRGVIVCLPKGNDVDSPEGYRPISLLTTDYKLLARIMAARLSTGLQDILHGTQFCGVPGNTILDSLAIIRDAIAISESTGAPLCVVSLHFATAFDNISHQYIFKILHRYGISSWFIERIRTLYDEATSSVQLNGTRSEPFPILCGVRQGCPLSMVLFALCLHPFLQMLTTTVSVAPGNAVAFQRVIAYADDVTILVP